MLFEITNVKEQYLLESNDFETACMAVILLGQGKYGLKQIDGSNQMPVLTTGIGKWVRETFNTTFTAWLGLGENLKEKQNEIELICDNITIGSLADRQAYLQNLALIDDPEKRTKWRQRWLNNRRSSQNDLCAQAWAYADRLRNFYFKTQNN